MISNVDFSVLLVEDNPSDAYLAGEWLSAEEGVQYIVSHAKTLEEAKLWLAKNSCDAAILDLNLPDSQGIDTLRAIKDLYEELPILVVTGAGGEAIHKAALEAGATEVMSKNDLTARWFAMGVHYVASFRRSKLDDEQINKILEAATDAMVVLDSDGEVQHVNSRALVLFNQELHDFKDELLMLSRTGGPLPEIKFPGERGDKIGSVMVTEVDWRGRKSYVASIRDITEQRRLESQCLASEKLATLGIVAANLAHEINNPLSAVMANLEFALGRLKKLAARGEETEEMIESLIDAREASERMRQIIWDVSVYSRPSDGKPDKVDLHTVLDRAVRVAWNKIRYRARVVTDYGSLPRVEVSESRLGQVFLNLLVNAAQAIAPDSEKDNRIEIKTELTPDGMIRVEFRDTGTGIPDEIKSEIFKTFFTTKNVNEGTGLGLPISRRIIEDLGGTIDVESEWGQGTTFTVVIPTARPTPKPASPGATIPTPRRVRRGQILVIDEDNDMGARVRAALKGIHQVIGVKRPESALELFAMGYAPKVIFCDLEREDSVNIDFVQTLEARYPLLVNRLQHFASASDGKLERDFDAAFLDGFVPRVFEDAQLLDFVGRLIEAEDSND